MLVEKFPFSISTDPERLDLRAIHQFLSTEAYWCKGITFETVRKSIDHSLSFGVYHMESQIGFARVISDFATVAYLGDVYILPEFRKQGLSKWLIQTVMEHPDLQGLRRWILLTGDAHSLYKKFGWREIANPERWMEIHDREVYTRTP